jgi:beta-phosphoglucomutase-like phosphatase (HAD superfamily)
MKFKAIIFDMDGTIVNTEHLWHKATATLIAKRGITLSPKNLHQRLSGLDVYQSCALIKQTIHAPESVTELIQEKTSLALSFYDNDITFIEGFTDFHQEARRLCLKMGIATNANDATLAITQQCLLLNSFFDNHVYGISCVNNVGKPNPAIYLHAAHQLGIDPHECIAIEDSANGIRAAQQAGMFCIGITTSGNPYQTEKAHLVVDSYKEIPLKELISA